MFPTLFTVFIEPAVSRGNRVITTHSDNKVRQAFGVLESLLVSAVNGNCDRLLNKASSALYFCSILHYVFWGCHRKNGGSVLQGLIHFFVKQRHYFHGKNLFSSGKNWQGKEKVPPQINKRSWQTLHYTGNSYSSSTAEQTSEVTSYDPCVVLCCFSAFLW